MRHYYYLCILRVKSRRLMDASCCQSSSSAGKVSTRAATRCFALMRKWCRRWRWSSSSRSTAMVRSLSCRASRSSSSSTSRTSATRRRGTSESRTRRASTPEHHPPCTPVSLIQLNDFWTPHFTLVKEALIEIGCVVTSLVVGWFSRACNVAKRGILGL